MADVNVPKEQPKNTIPIGLITNADVYPSDDNNVVFQLWYFESPEDFKARKQKIVDFVIDKELAKSIARRMTEILAAPDTKTAWDNIAARDAHEAPDFDNIPELTREERIRTDQRIAEAWKANGKVN